MYEWKLVHHHSIESRSTSCHPHIILPFQECWFVTVIHKLPDSIPDNIHRQFETACQFVLQSRHTPGLNIRQPPQIPPSPQRHLKFRLSLFYSTAVRGHGDLAEGLPFSFRFISKCLNNAHPWAR